MSGHSKWANIKHRKAAVDAKRADVFAKLAKTVTVAASQGGGDPETNYTLRTALERAKQFNLPKDRIDRAIKKGTGELKEGVKLESLILEAYGPGNAAILIIAITDNRNRTTSEIKNTLTKHGGKFAGEGNVRWMFEQMGVLRLESANVDNREDFELKAIEAGAEEIKHQNKQIVIYTSIENLQNAHKILEESGYNQVGSGLEWIAKNKIKVSDDIKTRLEKLYEALDEQEDVQEIYSNENQ
jgi:YebC/PmpR family DNA-binding regulatory protein